jgi:hypothetical protein
MTIDVDAIRAMVAATSDRYEVRDDMLTITFLPDATDRPEWWGRDYAACITLPPGDAAYFAKGRATMLALCDALTAEREKVRVLREAVDALAKPVQLWMAVVEEPSGKVTKKWGCRSFGECNDLITHLAAAALADDDVRAALTATEDGGGA